MLTKIYRKFILYRKFDFAKYYKNLCIIIAQVLSTRLHIFAKKISNFSFKHLFTFCTRQSTVRTTIAAIVRYRAIIRNIEWSKYKREVSAKG